MDIINREDLMQDLNLMADQIEGFYNILYDHRRGGIASCDDAMIETMSHTVKRLREKVMDAPPAK